jgi:hypothetical protein
MTKEELQRTDACREEAQLMLTLTDWANHSSTGGIFTISSGTIRLDLRRWSTPGLTKPIRISEIIFPGFPRIILRDDNQKGGVDAYCEGKTGEFIYLKDNHPHLWWSGWQEMTWPKQKVVT